MLAFAYTAVKVNPKDFDITPQVISEITDIPVSQIRRIANKKYVILVHRWHMLSVFVSYRKVGEWLLKLEWLRKPVRHS